MSQQPYPDPQQQPNWPPAAVTTTTGGYPEVTFDPPLGGPAPVAGLDTGVDHGTGQPVGQPVGNAADQSAPAQPQPAQQPAQQPAGMEDIGTILPQPDLVTLVSGRQVRVKKLKTVELLALAGIAITGLGGQLGNLRLDPEEPTAAFVAKFAGLTLAAAFTAEGRDQVLAFIRLVCEPVGKVTVGKIDKAVKARNDALDAALAAELENPEPDDTITIIEAIARNNAGDMQSWGKRLAGIWNLAQRTGQIPASPTSRA